MPRTLSLVSLSALFLLAAGCASSASPGDEEEGSDSALTHAEVAKEYDEKPEPLLENVAPSAAVAKLGVEKWTVYSGSKGRFVGLVLMGTNASDDVKYLLLIRTARRADGRLDIATYELDKQGKPRGAVSEAVARTLASDVKPLQTALAARSRQQKNTAAQDCTIGVTMAVFGVVGAVIGGFVITEVGLAAEIALEAGPLLTSVLGWGAASAALAGGVGVALSVIDKNVERMGRCGEDSRRSEPY